MKLPHFLLPLVFVVSGMFLVGASCNEVLENPETVLDDEFDKEPRYVITVHEIIKYRRGDSMLEHDIVSFFGEDVCINKNPLLHSRDIMKVEKVPHPGNSDFFDLRLTLSPRGQKLWSAFSVMTRMEGKRLGVVIDGMFYRYFKPAILEDEKQNLVFMEGPFDPATANGLVNNGERNYKIFKNK